MVHLAKYNEVILYGVPEISFPHKIMILRKISFGLLDFAG